MTTSNNLYIAYAVTWCIHAGYGLYLLFRYRSVRARASQLWPPKG
jgi:hypothetical protein